MRQIQNFWPRCTHRGTKLFWYQIKEKYQGINFHYVATPKISAFLRAPGGKLTHYNVKKELKLVKNTFF